MKLLYEPNKWHACSDTDWVTCRQGVNCYAYALNQPQYHWAVPGHGFAIARTQHYYDSFNAYFKGVSQDEFRRRLIAGAVKDGLIPVDTPEAREGYYAVALFFPGKPDNLDFHWYRKDDDGTWSHKDGWHTPSNKDAQGDAIHDPKELANTDYPVFGGFFLAPRKGIHLEQAFPLIA